MREKRSFLPIQERRFDALNAPQRVAEEIWERIRMRESECRSALGTREMSRGKEEVPPQPLQRGALQTRRRAQSLEPRQQVVRQQHELEEHLGTAEVLSPSSLGLTDRLRRRYSEREVPLSRDRHLRKRSIAPTTLPSSLNRQRPGG